MSKRAGIVQKFFNKKTLRDPISAADVTGSGVYDGSRFLNISPANSDQSTYR